MKTGTIGIRDECHLRQAFIPVGACRPRAVHDLRLQFTQLTHRRPSALEVRPARRLAAAPTAT
ncbi:hypothetical protein ACOKM5_07025 [Streptomyces sp. BH097]|uniref:hypothetical protein n=1 Tax=unclassified Streptomyces TaxID=2593676 RepID=UPI003BB67D3B